MSEGVHVFPSGSVRLDMDDGASLFFYMERDCPVDKARVMVEVPGYPGQGFRLSEDQTIALTTFFTPTRSST